MCLPVGYTNYNPNKPFYEQIKCEHLRPSVTINGIDVTPIAFKPEFFQVKIDDQNVPTRILEQEYSPLMINNLKVKIFVTEYQTFKSQDGGIEHKTILKIVHQDSKLEETFDLDPIEKKAIQQINDYILQRFLKTKVCQQLTNMFGIQNTNRYRTYTTEKPLLEQVQISKPSSKPEGIARIRSVTFDPIFVSGLPVEITFSKGSLPPLFDIVKFHIKCAPIHLDADFTQTEFEQVIKQIYETKSFRGLI